MENLIIILLFLQCYLSFMIYVSGKIKEVDDDLQECLGCDNHFDIETMLCDDDSNWFCQPCYDELSPVWEAEYKEAVERGYIDPE